MKRINGKTLVIFALLLVTFIAAFEATRPVESAGRYEYRVISITGMTELRTQSDADQGRLKAIENVLNQQTAQGWVFDQADGYVLYFHRQVMSR